MSESEIPEDVMETARAAVEAWAMDVAGAVSTVDAINGCEKWVARAIMDSRVGWIKVPEGKAVIFADLDEAGNFGATPPSTVVPGVGK